MSRCTRSAKAWIAGRVLFVPTLPASGLSSSARGRIRLPRGFTAEIKIPAGIDTELELTEGALTFDRAAAAALDPDSKKTYQAAAADLRDTSGTPAERLSTANSDDLAQAHTQDPLRDLVTDCGPWPLRVDRRRARRILVRCSPL